MQSKRFPLPVGVLSATTLLICAPSRALYYDLFNQVELCHKDYNKRYSLLFRYLLSNREDGIVSFESSNCFKVVEKNRPDVEQLLFWCQYWILVASVTVCERLGDHLISWLPMYGEAKLAFFVYLWYPEAKGTVNFYNRLLRPIVARHEDEIDQNLLELRIKFGKIASIYWQTAAAYGQARFLDILQYVSSQSASLHHSDQPETKAKTGEPRFLRSIGQAAEEKQSKESNASLSQQQHEPASELERIPYAPVSSVENGNHPHSCQQETISKESTYLTRGRWRIFQSSSRH